MALRGNLKDFSLPDVFQLVTFSKKTGVLRIARVDGAEGSVWFRDGDVFFAQSTWKREPLGERLVTAQKITPSALGRALELRAAEPEGGRRLGRILVDEGYITDSVLEAFVQEQIQDTIFDLMRWDEGTFDFEVLPDSVEEDIGLAVSIENVVMEGARRLEEWNRIRKKIPSMEIVFKMSTAPGEGTFEISLKPIEWNLLLLVDGTRSVADLARQTGRTDFEVARIIYGLFSAGLLEFASDEEVERLRAERAAREARFARVEPSTRPRPVAPPTEPTVKPTVAAAPERTAPAEVPEFLGSRETTEQDVEVFEEALGALLQTPAQPRPAKPETERFPPAPEPAPPTPEPPGPPEPVAETTTVQPAAPEEEEAPPPAGEEPGSFVVVPQPPPGEVSVPSETEAPSAEFEPAVTEEAPVSVAEDATGVVEAERPEGEAEPLIVEDERAQVQVVPAEEGRIPTVEPEEPEVAAEEPSEPEAPVGEVAEPEVAAEEAAPEPALEGPESEAGGVTLSSESEIVLSTELEVSVSSDAGDALLVEQASEALRIEEEEVLEALPEVEEPGFEQPEQEEVGAEAAETAMSIEGGEEAPVPVDVSITEPDTTETEAITEPQFETAVEPMSERLEQAVEPEQLLEEIEGGEAEDRGEAGEVISTEAYMADITVTEFEFSGGLGDELSALTGAGRPGSKPSATVNEIPPAGAESLTRDRRIDRETIQRIIDGIERL